MKVILINPSDWVVEDGLWDHPLGLIYLAAVLEARSIEVEVVDLNFYKNWQEVLTEKKADIFGVYCSSSLLNPTIEIAAFLRKIHPDSLLIVGGPHATCMPDDLRDYFDKVVIGEGENAIIEVITGESGASIIECDPIQDLDSIPYPARHLIPLHDYHRKVDGKTSTGIITSRGCPHKCAFCSKVWGNQTRFRSAENVLGEVRECKEKYGISALSIRDDTFTLKKTRLYKILEGFAQLGVVWRCLTRVDQVDEDVLRAMKESNCVEVIYGIESGSQMVLDRLQKRTTVEQNAEAIELAKKVGIRVKAAVIVGSPGETWETVAKTTRFIEKHTPDAGIVCVFTPYPGSPVWDDPERFGMKILSRDVTKYQIVGPGMRGNVVVETEEMNSDEIGRAHDQVLARFRELGLVPAEEKNISALKGSLF